MSKEPETISIEANGFSFAADIAGPTDGDLVLLLHGFPQTRHTWRAELPALGDAGFRACAPDQRGYSAGARPDGIDSYRIEHLIADVLVLAAALGTEQFHLVGHDWGGHLAWITAALHPERIRSLTVLSRPHPAAFARAMTQDAKQSSRSKHHRAFQRSEVTDELLADDCARLRTLLAEQGVPDPDAEAYLGTLGERAALDSAIHWYRAMGSSKVQAADVPAVSIPTLYVWGEADATVGRMAAEGTREFVKAPYRFVALPGVGHFVTDQAPDVFHPFCLNT